MAVREKNGRGCSPVWRVALGVLRSVVMAWGLSLALLAVLGTVGGSCNRRVVFDPDGCDRDDECPLANLHCDIPAGKCVTCTTDAHCVQLGLGFNRCDTALHRCIECGINSDCATGQICRDHHCVIACEGSGTDPACPSTAPDCEKSLGFCILCEEDNNACARASSPGPICNRAIGRCVACTADRNCGGTNPRCDTVTGKCVQCLAVSDCGEKAPICDPASMTCVPYP